MRVYLSDTETMYSRSETLGLKPIPSPFYWTPVCDREFGKQVYTVYSGDKCKVTSLIQCVRLDYGIRNGSSLSFIHTYKESDFVNLIILIMEGHLEWSTLNDVKDVYNEVKQECFSNTIFFPSSLV